MGMVIADALVALPCDGSVKIEKTSIYTEKDKIAAIGKAPSSFKEDIVIDGTDKLVIPGLINSHSHAYMSFMRNYADDLSFMDWLFGRVDPLEQKMTDEDAYWGASLGIMEMIKSGTTCFNDMQMNPFQTTRAVKESGIRAVICRGLVGEGNDEGGRRRIKETYDEMEFCKDCDRITFMMGPHAPYTCDEEFFRIVSDEAKKSNIGIHIHLSESVSEIEQIKEKYGCSPIEMAERNGIFDVPAIAAHCVQIDEKDMDILSAHNVSVVSNPVSNMKLGNGFAPIPEMLKKGINICLGTDGAASNNALNMFHEMNHMALIHKGTHRTPECIGAGEVFNMATVNGARALGLGDVTGSIEVGKKADLAVLNVRTPSLQPVNKLLAGLCYSANGSDVETVIIDGKIVMKNRKLLTMDEELIYDKVNAIIQRMGIEE